MSNEKVSAEKILVQMIHEYEKAARENPDQTPYMTGVLSVKMSNGLKMDVKIMIAPEGTYQEEEETDH